MAFVIFRDTGNFKVYKSDKAEVLATPIEAPVKLHLKSGEIDFQIGDYELIFPDYSVEMMTKAEFESQFECVETDTAESEVI